MSLYQEREPSSVEPVSAGVADQGSGDGRIGDFAGLYEAIFNNRAFGFAVVDAENSVLVMNELMHRWFPELDCGSCLVAYETDDSGTGIERLDEVFRTLPGGGVEVHRRIRVKGDTQGSREYRLITLPVKNEAGDVLRTVLLLEDISEGAQKEQRLRLMESALEAAANAVMILNADGAILWLNRAMEKLTGFERAELIGENNRMLKSPEMSDVDYDGILDQVCGGEVWFGELDKRRKDGSPYIEEVVLTPVLNEEGAVQNIIVMKRDITRRVEANRQKDFMEVQLRQAQKLESIGQLAAGIAHEINTPTQFVGQNLSFIQSSLEELLPVIEQARALVSSDKDDARLAGLREAMEGADLDFLMEELPCAATESLSGVGRIREIVQAMKEFSHPTRQESQLVNLNRCLENTLTVSRNEWKYVAEVKLSLAKDLPDVLGDAGALNQVFLNMIVIASHAIYDVIGEHSTRKGLIHISTCECGDCVEVSVADSGSGIPEDIRQKVFDPFFTTKEVGRGTGQGLAISYDVVVNKHGGEIDVKSEVGKGTTFFVRLPKSIPEGLVK